MTAPTIVVLDPHEVATARSELNLNSGAIQVTEAGPDWGDAQIVAQLAELARGEQPVGFRIANRLAKIPLLLGAIPDAVAAIENEVPNPSFEHDTVGQPPFGWAASGTGSDLQPGAALTVVASHAERGSNSCQVVTTAALANEGASISLGVLKAGTWTVGVWLAGNAGGEPVEVLAGNTSTPVTIFNATLTTALQQITGSFVADGINGCVLAVRTHTASVRTWFIDAAICVAGATLPAYFDGDSTGYYWRGAPGRSPSVVLNLSYEGARAALQKKVARLQAEGGWVKRGALFADVVDATLTYPDKTGAWHGVETDVILTLECIPDFYDTEIALANHAETTLPELRFTETTGIRGDYPGRLRLVVSNDQATDQRGLLAGIRSRHYDPAATAALAYEAEALTPLDVAAVTALSGASGGNTISHNNLSGIAWTPVMNTNLLAGAYLTHQGSYRVWTRVYSSANPNSMSLRFPWNVGDLVSPEINDEVFVPLQNSFCMVDLGEVRLDPAAAGTHRWQGQIQATGGGSLYIDRLYFIPLDEGAVRLTAPNTSLTAGLVSNSARDDFQNSGASVTGQTLPLGGTWAAGAGSDPTDFAITLGKVASRSEVNDVSWAGRTVIAGTGTLAALVITLDIDMHLAPSGARGGPICRYVDQNNLLNLRLIGAGNSSSSPLTLALTKRVAGVATDIATATLPNGTWYTLQMLVDAAGNYKIWAAPTLTNLGNPALQGQDSDLATGGALATGKYGFYDENTTPTTFSGRSYDNFLVYAPSLDAVAFASRLVQLGTDGNFRQDPTGAAYGPVSVQGGDLLRIPPSGIEGRTLEVLVKLTRGDLDQLPDSGIDHVSAQAFYRPSYLFPYQGE